MNTTKMKLTLLGICGLILVPFASHGADATLTNESDASHGGSQATLVNDTTVLFTIDFEFTDEIFNLEVPIVAESGVTYADRVDTVGFAIEGSEASVSASGLVLSRQPITGTRYEVPKGQAAKFTLFILAKFEEPLDEDVTARITKLPYWLDERRTTVHQNQLDDLGKPTLEVTK